MKIQPAGEDVPDHRAGGGQNASPAETDVPVHRQAMADHHHRQQPFEKIQHKTNQAPVFSQGPADIGRADVAAAVATDVQAIEFPDQKAAWYAADHIRQQKNNDAAGDKIH